MRNEWINERIKKWREERGERRAERGERRNDRR